MRGQLVTAALLTLTFAGAAFAQSPPATVSATIGGKAIKV